jgi:hypothetical protein
MTMSMTLDYIYVYHSIRAQFQFQLDRVPFYFYLHHNNNNSFIHKIQINETKINKKYATTIYLTLPLVTKVAITRQFHFSRKKY